MADNCDDSVGMSKSSPPEVRPDSPKPDEAGDKSYPSACSTPLSANSSRTESNSHAVFSADNSKSSSTSAFDTNEGGCSKEVHIGGMKKDDSGICIEKSPVKENSLTKSTNKDCAEDKAVASSSLDGDFTAGSSERPSVSNDSEGLVADIDTEDSETAASYCLAPEEMAVENSDSDSDDENSDVDNIDIESGVAEDAIGQSRKRRERDRVSSSSSSTSGPDDLDDIDMNVDDSDDAAGDDAVESQLKDSWHPLFEIRKRELGCGNHMNSPHAFKADTGASINLVKRLKRYKTLEHHEGCVNALHFNQTGTLLASGSDDLNIVVWNWAEGKPFFVFESGHRSNVFQSKFMPYTGDTHIVSCARDGQVRLAELSSTGVCKGTRKLAQHRGAAHKLSLLQDSSHVFYCCGEDAVAFEIDLRQEKPNKMCICKEDDKKVALYSIHSNPFKSYEFCTGGRDNFIRIYDKRKIDNGETSAGGALKKFCPHHLLNSDNKANVTCAVYNHNGTEVIGTYNDEDIYMFDTDHSEGSDYIHKYAGHRNNATVKGVNFYGPKSEFIVSGSDCGNVFLWEKESEEVVQYFHADDGGVINVLEPHPHCPILATSGLDHDVKVWIPSAAEPTKLADLKKTMKRNQRDRDEERSQEPEMVDGQMLWFLMQQLRRSARRRRREGDDEEESNMPRLGFSDSEEESEDDSDGQAEEPMQCVPS